MIAQANHGWAVVAVAVVAAGALAVAWAGRGGRKFGARLGRSRVGKAHGRESRAGALAILLPRRAVAATVVTRPRRPVRAVFA